MGVLRRSNEIEPSKVAAAHVPNHKTATVQAAVREVAEPGAAVYTGALTTYDGLPKTTCTKLLTALSNMSAITSTRTAFRTSGPCSSVP